MYGYQDNTPNAKEKKRRKQQAYQEALDRDAGKAAAVAVGGAQPQEHMFPQVQTKYTQQRQPNKGEQKGGSGGGAPLSMEVIMQRLDYFARYMQSNDGRMRELESNIVMLESQGDYQGKGPPGAGGDSKDARKLKLRVDELQTILAAEIKSRNISERELEQQIMSARENINQHEGSEQGAGGNSALAKKVSELSDKLHRTEAALQMETAERMELKMQIDAITSHESSVGSQIKKVQTDIEKEMFLNKVAADERKRQMELIRDAESKIVETREKIAESDHKRLEHQKESRNHIEFLEKQLAEQSDNFQHAMQEKSAHIDRVAAAMQSSQDKAVKNMMTEIKHFEDKVLLVEKNLHATLSESLRSLHTDLRIERENTEASHQEMKEVLSAEITSRRKAVGKTNGNVDKLFANQEEIIKKLQKLEETVNENVKEINENLCKIAGSFSEQLITLQEVAKTAVRTLQIDQVSLTAKLKNSMAEYKQLHKLLEDRADASDSHIAEVEIKLKSEAKKLNNRIDYSNRKLEERSSELSLRLDGESEKRQEDVRKINGSINTTMESYTSRMNDLASEFDSKINHEATSRSNAIISAEKRQQDCLAKQEILNDDKISILKDTVNNEMSYAISMENQTRTLNIQKMSKSLQAQMKTLTETTNELIASESKERRADLEDTKQALQTFENELSYAISIENQTRSINSQKISKLLNAKLKSMDESTKAALQTFDNFLHTQAEHIRTEFEERDLSAQQAKRRLERKLDQESRGLADTDENLRKLISINEDNYKCAIADVKKDLVASSADVLREVDRKEIELLQRLKVELMEQLLASHVKAQSHRQQVETGLRRLEVRSCLDNVVDIVVETSVMESFGSKFEAVERSTTSDTTEAKAYVDLATKFLDKKLMAGFDDYNKRLAKNLAEVRKDVHAVSDNVLSQVEKNDLALLSHLKQIHAKSSQHRHQLEEGLVKVEVGSCVDRIVSTIVDLDNSSSVKSNIDPSSLPATWASQQVGGDKGIAIQTTNSKDSAMRKNITAEIDLKINAVGIEVLDRMQKLQIRNKELEALLESYDLPVLLSSVTSLRHDVADAAEELHVVREELNHVLAQQQGSAKILADAMGK